MNHINKVRSLLHLACVHRLMAPYATRGKGEKDITLKKHVILSGQH